MDIAVLAILILLLLLCTAAVGLLTYGAYQLYRFEKKRMKLEHDAQWEVFSTQYQDDFEHLLTKDRSN